MISLQSATIPLIVVDERVRADIAPEVKKVTRVIYGILDTVENKIVYVGKTGQELSKRIAWYTCMINKMRDEKPVERAAIIEKLASEPDRYCFTLLRQASQDESLSQVEQDEIEAHAPSLNSNHGGGGGSSFLSPVASRRVLAPVHAESPISPIRNFRVVTGVNGRVAAEITPNTRKLTNVIYRIRNIVTGKIYIGQTSCEFGKRISSHMWRVNADDNKVIRGQLHQEIADNPENFDVGIIRHFDEDFNLDVLETEIIEHAKQLGSVYNKRNGGGGSKRSASSAKLTGNVAKQLAF